MNRQTTIGYNKFIQAFYSDSKYLLAQMITAGKANIYTGFQGSLGLFDMLHGGAYAAPINQRPYFMADPSLSPYYAGDLTNIDQGGGLAGFFATLGSGQNAKDLFKQLLMNANVPHVLPKLISDEAYGQFMILHAQAGTNFVVAGAATGLKTLVEAISEPFTGEEKDGEKRSAARESGSLTREGLAFLRATLAEAASTAAVVGA